MRSLISMYILNVELTVFPFRFDMDCDRKKGDKEDVKISAEIMKVSEGVFGGCLGGSVH